MNKLCLLVLLKFIPISFCQIGSTVDEEVLIRKLTKRISQDSCDHHVRNIQTLCCASQPILGVFERVLGLRSVRLCQIYVRVCSNNRCGLQCRTLSCFDVTEEDRRMEQMIQSHFYTDQQLLGIMLPDLLLLSVAHPQPILSKAVHSEGEVTPKRVTSKAISLLLKLSNI